MPEHVVLRLGALLCALALSSLWQGCGPTGSQRGATDQQGEPPEPSTTEPASGQPAPTGASREPAYLSWAVSDCAFGPLSDLSAVESESALEAALGQDVASEPYESEGEAHTHLVARWQGEVTLIASERGYEIRTPRVTGPSGIRVGATGAEMARALRSAVTCLRGGEEVSSDVFCTPADLPWLTLRFADVPPSGDCVTACEVAPSALATAVVSALILRPCR